MDARRAVDPSSQFLLGTNLIQQLPPTLSHDAGIFLPSTPGIVAATRHLQHAAKPLNLPVVSMLVNPGELHGCSLAKNAAAFFKMSLSISDCRNCSRRSRI